MREPSIHIKEKSLTKIIAGMGLYKKGWTPKEVCEEILRKAKECTVNERSITITNARTEKKAKSILKSGKGDANLFATLLVTIRKKLKHRGVRSIKEDSKDYPMLKECAALAVDFSDSFNLDKREGFIAFIKLSIENMARFTINKIPSLYPRVCEMYEAMIEIAEDSNIELTERAYQRYCTILVDKIGHNIEYRDRPDKMIGFVRTSASCLEMKIKPETWIDAQFDAFSWREGIPDPHQIYGDKAKERVLKYLFENNLIS